MTSLGDSERSHAQCPEADGFSSTLAAQRENVPLNPAPKVIDRRNRMARCLTCTPPRTAYGNVHCRNHSPRKECCIYARENFESAAELAREHGIPPKRFRYALRKAERSGRLPWREAIDGTRYRVLRAAMPTRKRSTFFGPSLARPGHDKIPRPSGSSPRRNCPPTVIAPCSAHSTAPARYPGGA